MNFENMHETNHTASTSSETRWSLLDTAQDKQLMRSATKENLPELQLVDPGKREQQGSASNSNEASETQNNANNTEQPNQLIDSQQEPTGRRENFDGAENIRDLPLKLEAGKDGDIIRMDNGYSILINHMGVEVRDSRYNTPRPDNANVPGSVSDVYGKAGIIVGPQGETADNHKLHNRILFSLNGRQFLLHTRSLAISEITR